MFKSAAVKPFQAVRERLKHAVRATAFAVPLPNSLWAWGPYRRAVVPPQNWEREYADGEWSHMKTIRELGRYSAIAGYYGFMKAPGTILDIGCGEGILQQRLSAHGYQRYLGIDICDNAIRAATAYSDQRTTFRQADIESFVPEEKFDTIIFNEVFYYLADPARIVRCLTDSLESDGIMIASIVTSLRVRANAARIWRLIEGIVEILDSTTVINQEAWTIKVFKPKIPVLQHAT
jgi:2-polyprenyl-3-methyl-5-hydroxy-6-metoxy-1,4-benzoquinol methylase